MQKRTGISRLFKWTAVAGCVTIGLTWVISLLMCLDLATGNPWYVTTHPGAIHIEACDSKPTARIVLREQLYDQFPVVWWFESSSDADGNWSVTIPLWVVFLPSLVLAGWAWRWNAIRRAGCNRCGCNLGDYVSGVCPKCDEPTSLPDEALHGI